MTPSSFRYGIFSINPRNVHFDPQEGNYWGYMTLIFSRRIRATRCAKRWRSFARWSERFMRQESRWLDVVYNHTCEGDQTGPTYSWRGIDNSSYYLLGPDGQYRNDSGCGNMLRCAHEAARLLILCSLRHWVNLGADGFRFDLASALARDAQGQVQTEEAAVIRALAVELDLAHSPPGCRVEEWRGGV